MFCILSSTSRWARAFHRILSETVRYLQEGGVALEPLRGETNLHRCQHWGNKDGGGGYPGQRLL